MWAAGLKSMSRWLPRRMASLRALRSVARMRCMLAGLVVRWPRTVARIHGLSLCRAISIAVEQSAIAVNMASMCSTRSLTSGMAPRWGIRWVRMCDS
ncbi:hypothetical protein B0E53_03059 [Micromonospora sp. MH33]|nr:hypothetical protein B0E53_03059 [Micromonospora sp. MH33]